MSLIQPPANTTRNAVCPLLRSSEVLIAYRGDNPLAGTSMRAAH
jgi:hypothetical protein